MKHEKKIVEYVMLPILSAGWMIVFIMVAGDTFLWNFYEQWTSIFVTGEIAYEQDASHKTVKKESGKPGEGLVKGKQYGTVTCREKDLYAPLYYGDSKEILAKGAGTYTGYGVPGVGSTILTGAHDTTYYEALEQIEAGDVIVVDTYWGTYQYQVEEKRITKASENSAYELQEGENLIMYTCYPFGAEGEERLERCFVYAKRMEEED